MSAMEIRIAEPQRSKQGPPGSVRRRGLTLVEITLAAAVLVLGLMGSLMFRYQAALGNHKAEVQETAARLASALLQAWTGAGGHSGYPRYELENPLDYDPADPNDYDPSDMDALPILPGLEVITGEPGLAVPTGFTLLDACNNPNYRIVVNGVNYYATLSYSDQESLPRVLSVDVAWMENGGSWQESGVHRSVSLMTYAND